VARLLGRSSGYGIRFDVPFFIPCAGKSADACRILGLYCRVTRSEPAPEHEEIDHVLECKKKNLI
jgi:hypothetical protein